MSWYDLIDKNGTAVIPDGTVEIPENVYSHCGTLKSVILPSSVRVIGRHAFDSCVSLESAVLPDGLVEVGDYAFRLCHRLHISHLPDSVVRIGDGAFDTCKLPEALTFTNVAEVGGMAFNECWGLKSISIPAETRTIGTFAFLRCKDLERISADPGNPIYSASGNCLLSKDGKSLFQGCNTSVIPDGVEEIHIGAFSGMSVLKSISIPESVGKMERGPFMECWGLESITVEPGNANYMSSGNCLLSKDGTVLIAGCRSSVIPDSVKVIAKCAFWGCQTLERINIPDSVTEIGEDAFHHCRSLRSITIPDSVTSIGLSAFLYCTNFEVIRINNPDLLKRAASGNATIVRN